MKRKDPLELQAIRERRRIRKQEKTKRIRAMQLARSQAWETTMLAWRDPQRTRGPGVKKQDDS